MPQLEALSIESSEKVDVAGDDIAIDSSTNNDNGGGNEGEEEVDRSRKENIIIPGLLQRLTVTEVGEELRSLWKIGLPIVATSFLHFSKSVISMLFLGHMGKIELAGGSLAISFSNITGQSVMKGLSMGMDPICCQAFGAKRFSVLSQTYLKTVCLLLVAALPVSLMWLNVEPIFRLLGQDEAITKTAKVFMVFSIPDLLAMAHLFPIRVFLRTQSINLPTTVATGIASIIHFPVTYFLVVYLKLGPKGVALATGWHTITMNAVLIAYVFLSKSSLKPWTGASLSSAFKGWKPLLALSLPSACSVCLEWWWYEIIMFLCGLLNNSQDTVATMGILIQTTGLIYVFPYSLSLGLSIRVGQHLGSGQPARAQWITIIGIGLAVIVGILSFTFTLCVRSVWGKLYTREASILGLLSTALPILGLSELGNSPQTAAAGILNGSARPKIGARINFCAFYLVGLPVAVVVAFKLGFGFLGLLFGLVAAQLSCTCMMVYTLVQTDWRHETKRAEELTLAALEKQEVEAELVP